MLGDMCNFPLAFSIAAGACLLGVVAAALIRTPDHEEAKHHFSWHGFMHQMHWDLLEEVVDHALHPEHYRRVGK